jgi:voltage-gated potassium channel
MSSAVRLRVAILLLLGVVALGVVGYEVIEGAGFLDALYMTIITLSTVGFQEVVPLGMPGRVFTMALIVIGVTTAWYLAGNLMSVIIGQAVGEEFARRRMEEQLQTLRDHTIICGYGRMGQEISRDFTARGFPFVVIEPQPERTRLLADEGILYVEGDAAQDDILLQAGVLRARGLVSVAPTDADNIFIVLSARALNPQILIVARSIHVEDEHKLRRAGADRVISPYVIGARRMAAAIFHPHVVDFLDLEIHRAEMEWEMGEIRIGPESVFRDRPLREARIREETGCTIIAIRPRPDGDRLKAFVSNPRPDTILREGDTLIVLGATHQLADLERLAGGSASP